MKVDRICDHSFFARLDGHGVVVDLGANHGEFAHTVIDTYGCRVFSAEPVPELAAGIAARPGLTLLPLALSGHCGTVGINVYDDRCASSYPMHDGEGAARTVKVEAVTLSEFRRRAGIGRIDLLKVDIEGAELPMFATAADEEFADIDQITVEFHDFIYPDTRAAVDAVKRRLNALGFRVMPFSMDNTDVLFVNRRAPIDVLDRLWARTAVKYGRGIRRRIARWAAGIRPTAPVD